ncbi:MAG: type I-E CRISPR-associated endoribonuclease Cas2e [Dermatophilaceae bacterium]|nr:type I-E CRISPR-associated endoribonuclease Cas2 [Actinomycetales bacterium]
MVVLVLTACPAGLRGHLTRWLMEISPGVFVGHVTARVREDLWLQVIELCKDGKALLVHSTRTEQRLAFRAHRHEWDVVEVDGFTLVRRPASPGPRDVGQRPGWSNAAKWRRAARE